MAEPVGWMAAATVLSTAFNIYANNQQNDMQAKMAGQKKEFLEQQKHLIEKSKQRDLDIFQRQVDEILGQQQVGYAVAGVEYTDSAVRAAQQVIGLAEEEKIAIEEQAAANLELTDYKISVQSMTQDFYRNIGPYQSIGIGLGGIGQLARYSMKPYNMTKKSFLG